MRRKYYERLTPEQKEAYLAKERVRQRARRERPEVKAQQAAYSQEYRAKSPPAYLATRQRYIASLKDGRPQIYFVQAASGPIKIGFVKKAMVHRLKDLQVGNHEVLTLIGWKLGTVSEERALHVRFRHLRIRGEWFRPAPELLALVKKHPPTST